MTNEHKHELALTFIRQVRDMSRDVLNRLIHREAGEELVRFFLEYSKNLLEADPQKSLENASSLLLMGYLIRAAEERAGVPVSQHQGELLH